jgi:short-subunit dehydrogenase
MSQRVNSYFEGKTVWITGASSGIGKAMAIQLAGAGARLILSGRNREALEQVAEFCDSEFFVLPFDMADYRNFGPVAEAAIDIYDGVDILVNNAGQGCRSLAVETDLHTDERIMQVNYMGNIGLTKALLPSFLERGSGHIIVVSSLAGKFGTKSRSAYAASKHALHGFYESLMAEVHDQGIRITIACPGFVETSLLERSWNGRGERVGQLKRNHKRMTAAECGWQIMKAAAGGKEEVIIGESFKERVSVDIKRFFPGLFSRMMKRVNVS